MKKIVGLVVKALKLVQVMLNIRELIRPRVRAFYSCQLSVALGMFDRWIA